MSTPLSTALARLNWAHKNRTLQLAASRQELNLATVDTLDRPQPYCDALNRYSKILLEDPTEFGNHTTRPFLRFFELLDAKKESLFETCSAWEEYDNWFVQVEQFLEHAMDSSASKALLAQVLVDHQWDPLPLLHRCEENQDALEQHAYYETPKYIARIAHHAIAELGYNPVQDDALLHGVWASCLIDDAPASYDNEMSVLAKIERFAQLFPTSINAAMVDFYEENDGNVTPEMQLLIANMDLSHASGDGLNRLLQTLNDWRGEGNEAWDIVANKHARFCESLDVHAGLGYSAHDAAGWEMLRMMWRTCLEDNQSNALELPALDVDSHGH